MIQEFLYKQQHQLAHFLPQYQDMVGLIDLSNFA